jgi:hypothetical protein
MKLRCQANSIRLRLKRGEVDQLVKTGRVEEHICFGPGQTLTYRLETSSLDRKSGAAYNGRELVVHLPTRAAADWASGDQVGIEVSQPAADRQSLQILIEKDFACLNGTEDQNADTFDNPLAGTKC